MVVSRWSRYFPVNFFILCKIEGAVQGIVSNRTYCESILDLGLGNTSKFPTVG